MPLPTAKDIKIPILYELSAVGGTDEIRFLYKRLAPYFPALSDADVSGIINNRHSGWRKVVQKAGKLLDEENLITRSRGTWSLTECGQKAIEAETLGIVPPESAKVSLSHKKIQEMLVDIGKILGFHAEAEFDHYDVIWRKSSNSQRISHVFEVNSKGNLDSAFAKLKRAFDAQRSIPFLILTNERNTKRAKKSLLHEFRELENVITILGFTEVCKIHENLTEISAYLLSFLET
jgi:hypothetical protein